MDNYENHRLSISPNAMKRSAVQATAEVLRKQFPALAHRIDALQTNAPLAKPATHIGGPETDCLSLVALSDTDVEAIFDALFELEGDYAGRTDYDERLLDDIASLVDRWNEIDQFRSGSNE